jgi:O-antigen ligase
VRTVGYNPRRRTGTNDLADAGRWSGGSVILLLIFVYFWIGITPFADQSGVTTATNAGNQLNQFIVVFFSLIALVTVWRHPMRGSLLGPHGLLLLMLLWFCFVSLFASSPDIAFRRIVNAVLVCGCASAALLLPRDTKEFARILAVGTTLAILLSYFLVIVVPRIGIHQSNEVEALLAGSWRGHFGHKNEAAAAMAYAVFIGLYLRKAYYPKLGTALVVLATVFLYFAGGKTSTGMLPAVLLFAWMFERWRLLRYVIVFGLVITLNVVLIGSATSDFILSLVKSTGIDATFTGRTVIWAFSLDIISEKLFTGYGFQSFWQNDAAGKATQGSWAFIAAHSHNSFLEALINAGIPGFILVVLWLIALPVRDAGRAFATDNDPALTRLFLRIWLFSILLACLENVFFVNTGPIWFTMLLSVFGIRLQSRARLAATYPTFRSRKLANA